MRWRPGNRGNIEDMRASGGGRTMSLGIGGFIVLLLLSWATGTDFLSLFQGGIPIENTGTSGTVATTPEEEQMVDFVDAVTADAQRTWAELLGGRYEATNWNDMGINNKAKNAAISYGLGVEADETRPQMLLAVDRSVWGGQPKFEFNNKAIIGNLGTNVTQLKDIKWDEKGMHQNAGNAALADGSVQQLTSARLRETIQNSGDILNRYSQPGKTSTQ